VLEVPTFDDVSTSTRPRTYTITEASTLTGLPASTLRYYESVGVITPIARGESSRHRVYDEQDLDQLIWVACLAATGMSIGDMKRYGANRTRGAAGAGEQIELLRAQQRRLAADAAHLAVRQRYVDLKIDYWRAVAAGDDARAEVIATEAGALAGDLKRPLDH
jgi:DNA-binding transcriptional MerR regulator